MRSLRRHNDDQHFADQHSDFRCLGGRCVGARSDGRCKLPSRNAKYVTTSARVHGTSLGRPSMAWMAGRPAPSRVTITAKQTRTPGSFGARQLQRVHRGSSRQDPGNKDDVSQIKNETGNRGLVGVSQTVRNGWKEEIIDDTNTISSWSARGVISAVVIPAVVSMPLILMAQEAIPPYCSDLKRVAGLAMTNERFASISAKPRDGNFAELQSCADRLE